MLDPLELETVVNPLWVLGTEPRAPGRASSQCFQQPPTQLSKQLVDLGSVLHAQRLLSVLQLASASQACTEDDETPQVNPAHYRPLHRCCSFISSPLETYQMWAAPHSLCQAWMWKRHAQSG